MARHILARRGETWSALVKYLSNRAFHSRVTGVAGKESSKGTKGMATPRSASLIFIRKISRGDGDDGADKVQSRFYCPLLEGGLSTFLCPAEIHGARKCLLKISTSVADPPPRRPASPSSRSPVLLFQTASSTAVYFSSFLDFRPSAKLSRLIRALLRNFALIDSIRTCKSWDAINFIRDL